MEIKTILREEIDIDKQTKEIIETPKRSLQEKLKEISVLKLPLNIRVTLEFLEMLTYWQDERKKATFWTTHYLSIIIQEIGNR